MHEFDLKTLTPEWSLFLDRDGVINVDKPGSYIFHPDEFHFMPGAPELFQILSKKFQHIFVVTNQRGVGRGLMTEETLNQVNQKMKDAIEKAGGKLDAVYYATSIHDDDPMRKPHAGMAMLAKNEFPTVEAAKCIMIGNNISDMEFGRNAGMRTIFLTTTIQNISLPHPDIDLIFPDLAHFAKAL